MKTLLRTSCALALVAALGANVALAASQRPKILPLRSAPYGMTYSEWGDAYWQWVNSIPVDTNPLLDTTGEFAGGGQSRPGWFLASSILSGTVVREVTVPAGKGLFVPVFGVLWINVPELGDPPWSDGQEAVARAYVAELVNQAADSLSCEIDGVPVPDLTSYRSSTGPDAEFMVAFPENNLWSLPAGTYGPSVQDGVYLLLPSLPAGTHTIHVSADSYYGSLDVTYDLTILK